MTTTTTADVTISVRHIVRKQERNHGPHVYESIITVEGATSWDRLLKHQAKAVAQVLVHPFTEEPPTGTMEDHSRSRLVAFEMSETERLSDNRLGPQRQTFRIRVETPYTD